MSAEDPLALYSRGRLALFGRYAQWYFLRHFNSLRIARHGSPPPLLSHSILFANHPSWWDPITLLLFATRQWPLYRIFAPIDTEALERYSILRRLGLFPVEPGYAGARNFLRIANRVLDDPGAALALTAQGRFVDPRMRPIELEPGLTHLLRANPMRYAIPVALEYVHWTERLPEALVAFGEPVRVRAGESADELHSRLETALEETAERLAAAAAKRDPADFEILMTSSRRGTGKLYDAYERIRAALRGRAFHKSHRALED